jgi:hypothetical protein
VTYQDDDVTASDSVGDNSNDAGAAEEKSDELEGCDGNVAMDTENDKYIWFAHELPYLLKEPNYL